MVFNSSVNSALVSILALPFIFGCSIPEYEEPDIESETAVEPIVNDDNDGPAGEEYALQKLVIEASASVNGNAPTTFELTPVTVEGNVVLISPSASSAPLLIPATEDDRVALSLSFVIRPAHAIASRVNRLAAFLDTYYYDEQTSDLTSQSATIHRASSFEWSRQEDSSFIVSYSFDIVGLREFNTSFEHEIATQQLTFEFSSGTDRNIGIVAFLPIQAP